MVVDVEIGVCRRWARDRCLVIGAGQIIGPTQMSSDWVGPMIVADEDVSRWPASGMPVRGVVEVGSQRGQRSQA